MSYIAESLRRLVNDRAKGRCEFCHIPDEFELEPHEVDHIRAVKHRGTSTEDNLCLTCLACNRHKGSDFASFDPETDEIVLLFHPRQDQWDQHFSLKGAEIIGRTPTGRATVALLRLNSPERLAKREALIELGFYP